MLLLIREHENTYGIDTTYICEIIYDHLKNRLPACPYGLVGMCNYKNQAIPVLSMSELTSLSGKAQEDRQKENMMLIVRVDEEKAAIEISALGEVVSTEGYKKIGQKYVVQSGQKVKISTVYEAEETILEIDLKATLENLKVR